MKRHRGKLIAFALASLGLLVGFMILQRRGESLTDEERETRTNEALSDMMRAADEVPVPGVTNHTQW